MWLLPTAFVHIMMTESTATEKLLKDKLQVCARTENNARSLNVRQARYIILEWYATDLCLYYTVSNSFNRTYYVIIANWIEFSFT